VKKHKLNNLLLLSRVFDIPKGDKLRTLSRKTRGFDNIKNRNMDHLLHHTSEKILNIFSKFFPEKLFRNLLRKRENMYLLR
jgi:hypothetical protein